MSTKIEWASDVCNPMPGCSPCSEACTNCYGRRFAVRHKSMGTKGYENLTDNKGRWTGKTAWVPERMDQVLRWKKPRRIFWNSMGDSWNPNNSFENIAAMFGVMAATPQHTHLLLTKRPERMLEWFGWANPHGSAPIAVLHFAAKHCGGAMFDKYKARDYSGFDVWPFPNVHLGVTVENQKRTDRIETLLRCPAALYFVSYEPALGPVDFSPWLWPVPFAEKHDLSDGHYRKLDFLICGAETGPGKRHMELGWARDIRDACVAASVPFFFKKDSQGRRELDGKIWSKLP